MQASRVLVVLAVTCLSACVTITEVSDRRMLCASNQANCSQRFRVNFNHGFLMGGPGASATFTTSHENSAPYSQTIELQQDDGSDPPNRYQYEGNWNDRQAFGWCPRTVHYEARGRVLGIFPDTDTESIVIPGDVERVEVFTDNFTTMRSQILNGSTVSIGPLSTNEYIGIWSTYDNAFTINTASLTCSGGQDCSAMANPPIENILLGSVPATIGCGGLYTANFRCTAAARSAGQGGELTLNTSRGNFVVSFFCQEPPGA